MLLEDGELSVKRGIILKDAEMFFGHMIRPWGRYCIMTLIATGLNG